MNLSITNGAKRILSKEKRYTSMLFHALEDIEVVLDQTYFRGHIVLEGGHKNLCLDICSKSWMNESTLMDLYDQITYIIWCNRELNLPLKFNGKIFN
jgi:hypothetical protein